ncbi:acyltransferase [Piscinibacter sp. HJYY11]|uniref:acyltransferase family protein n=1 Tax=Piscinibacter sp. HJYY11 TaxID=2801333 RepID=UPI00191D904D|nr:acyltransferase [Piscinibacter sp. HJYY11]MBL0728250.1 acyltransferase [Piscinibacter sp. HJYY11]
MRERTTSDRPRGGTDNVAGPEAEARQTIELLQLARGMAALAVAAYHLSQQIARELPALGRPFWDVARHGHLGVQFFFALSGFIILYAHAADVGRPSRLGTYLHKRAVRIYPLYWIVLALVAAGIHLKGANGLADVSSATSWLSQVLLLKLDTSRSVVGQAWTLFHEVFFYLLFALAILHRRLGVLVLATWFLCCLCLWEIQDNVQGVRDVLLGVNNLFFLAGMLAFWMAPRLGLTLARFAFAGGAVLFLWGTTAFPEPDPTRVAAEMTWLLSFVLVIAGGCALERHGAFGRLPRWMTFIGDASYSIYLIHWHVQTYALRFARELGLADLMPGRAFWIVVLGLSVLVGCALYVAVERPLLGFLKRGRPPIARQSAWSSR